MRNWANKAVALALGVLVATTAQATPDRFIGVTEQLFARNDDTVMILRQVTDNHGSYYVLQTDTVLVHRNMSGQSVRFDYVERATHYSEFNDPPVVFDTPDGSVRPYNLRAALGAWPLSPDPFEWDAITITEDGMFFGSAEWREYGLDAAALRAQFASSLGWVREISPATFNPAGDPFDPAQWDPIRDCTAARWQPLRRNETDPALVRLDCADADSQPFAQIWIIVPQL